MSQSKKNNAAEDLMASLMEELNLSAEKSNHGSDDLVLLTDDEKNIENSLHGLVLEVDEDDVREVDVLTSGVHRGEEPDEMNMASILNPTMDADSLDSSVDFSIDEQTDLNDAFNLKLNISDEVPAKVEAAHKIEPVSEELTGPDLVVDAAAKTEIIDIPKVSANDATVAMAPTDHQYASTGDSEKTVAIAGYSKRHDSYVENNVKVSVGQSRSAMSSGYASWGNSDSQLAQAENLRIAQEKILEIEKENEKLRLQNEELIAASEIIKERADLLSAQVQEFKSDRDGLDQSFKNEMQLVRNQYHRKDNELQKAQMKIDELDSRLKFDMKKIRIRERELENRLEMIRAEKNALMKSKDEQILDLRRKMDQVQLEADSYRQKCVELNKVLDTNQDSFKRTTRALRLAMANLELQDENKVPLKKAD